MIRFIQYSVTVLAIALLARYIYLDVTFNDSIITNQIKVDAYEIFNTVIDFAELSHAQRH